MVNFVWGYTCFEKYNIARAKLVPVPNRTLEFKIPKTLQKQGKVLISLTNQRKRSRLNNLTYAFTVYTKKGNATDESL